MDILAQNEQNRFKIIIIEQWEYFTEKGAESTIKPQNCYVQRAKSSAKTAVYEGGNAYEVAKVKLS